ncbi:MAG: hypothetical protein ACK5NF_03420 [Bacilli bacterium]
MDFKIYHNECVTFRKKVIINVTLEILLVCILCLMSYKSVAFVIGIGVFVSNILVLKQIVHNLNKS